MTAGADIAARAAVKAAAAMLAFAAAGAAYRLAGRWRPREFLVAGALYWTVFLAEMAPLFAASALHVRSSAAFPATLILCAAALAGAVWALVRGHRAGVLVAAVALMLRIAADIVLGAGYSFLVQ